MVVSALSRVGCWFGVVIPCWLVVTGATISVGLPGLLALSVYSYVARWMLLVFSYFSVGACRHLFRNKKKRQLPFRGGFMEDGCNHVE